MLSVEDWVDIRSLHKQGYTIAAIVRELGVARNTVRRALRQDQSPRYTRRKPRASKLDPYKDYLKARLQEFPELSGVRLLEEIQAQGYMGQRTILKDFLRPLRTQIHRDLTVRFETMPGQQGQIDWAHFGTLVEEEEVDKLYGFVFVLGYSRAIYVEFTRSQNIESLLRCHLHAFDYFGGYPRELLYDHMKTVILTESPDGQGRRWNPRFLDFAGYYGFAPRLCRPYRARTKGKVERSIGYVKDNFFAGRSFTGLEDLNHQALLWCDTKANPRVHATTREVPFERLKRENLLSHRKRPLYDTSEVVARKVSRDCYLSFKGNFYSVPWRYGARALTVRATPEGILEIWADGNRVGSHRLCRKKGQTITERAHLKGSWTRTCSTSKASVDKILPLTNSDVVLPGVAIPEVQQRSLSIYEDLIDP